MRDIWIFFLPILLPAVVLDPGEWPPEEAGVEVAGVAALSDAVEEEEAEEEVERCRFTKGAPRGGGGGGGKKTCGSWWAV